MTNLELSGDISWATVSFRHGHPDNLIRRNSSICAFNNCQIARFSSDAREFIERLAVYDVLAYLYGERHPYLMVIGMLEQRFRIQSKGDPLLIAYPLKPRSLPPEITDIDYLVEALSLTLGDFDG